MTNDTDDVVATDDFERLLAQEMLIENATEKILELMELEDVSKADLARRVGRSRAFITQLMAGDRNMTLRTLADLAHALDHTLTLAHSRAAAKTTDGWPMRLVTGDRAHLHTSVDRDGAWSYGRSATAVGSRDVAAEDRDTYNVVPLLWRQHPKTQKLQKQHEDGEQWLSA